MLRVREKLASGALPGGICAGSTSAVEHDSHDVVSEGSAGSSAAGLVLHDLEGSVHVSNGALVRSALAGGSLHDLEDFLPALVMRGCVASTEGDVPAHATAGDSEEIIGLLERSVSQSSCLNSDNSSMGVACVDPASAAAAFLAPVLSSPCSRVACAAGAVHARYTVSPMHDVNAQNSWSDTGSFQGPRGRKRSKGGVSGPAEDLRPVSEVEAGVNFRPAGGVRGQVAGSLPRRQPGTGTRQVRGGVDTPSLHPEVSGIQFVSPGRGLDIRQSVGWTKVCSTTRSGIWVLKGNARARVLPENLDHLRVRWISRGTYETAWVTPGHDCLCSYQYGQGAAVRPQTNDAIWRGVIGLWGRVAPLLSPWCGRRELPTGVNLIAISNPCSAHRIRLSS